MGGGFEKTRKTIFALILAAVTIAMLAPVHAVVTTTRDTGNENASEGIGTRLSMYRGFQLNSCSFTDPNVAPGDTTFPANTALFVSHGWINSFYHELNSTDQQAFNGPNTTFELYIDGVQAHSTHDNSLSGDAYIKLLTSNLNGMTGTHTFVGIWYIDAHLNGDGPYGVEDFAIACALRVHFV